MESSEKGDTDGSATSSTRDMKNKKVAIFIHLDLGIGGAEQLVLNLATATTQLPTTKTKASSTDNDNNVPENDSDDKDNQTPTKFEEIVIYTTHCDPKHCFAQVKPPDGPLHKNVRIHGAFIPRTLFRGKGMALCSAIRVAYLTLIALWHYGASVELWVLDVLPVGLPLIRFWRWIVGWSRKRQAQSGSATSNTTPSTTTATNINANSTTTSTPSLPAMAILFYCHFPDKLLTRDTINGIPTSTSTSSKFRMWYRRLLDSLEEFTMSFADLIVVNSKFTMGEVQRVFPSLVQHGGEMQVLYPAIDLDKFVPPSSSNTPTATTATTTTTTATTTTTGYIVSLNRFERKKNIGLLLKAYAQLKPTKAKSLPTLIVAGGYDPRNQENVHHLQELQSLAQELNLGGGKVLPPGSPLPSTPTTTTTNDQNDSAKMGHVVFMPSVSDTLRATLLQQAFCVCYTPHREHFGIVPLEAMYAGSPVVACQSGGPMETVSHNETGCLVQVEGEGIERRFAQALQGLLDDEFKAKEMGRRGHERVKEMFGWDKFCRDWEGAVGVCVEQAWRIQHNVHVQRHRGGEGMWHASVTLVLDGMLAFLLAYVVKYILNHGGGSFGGRA